MKPTVLLVNSPGWFTETGESRTFEIETPPLGLLYMAATVRAAGFDVRIVDVGAERISYAGVRAIIGATRPWAVGIAAMTLQLQGALDVAKLVREHDRRVPIFLGGPHISSDEGFVSRHASLFDHGITGEAETTFPESLLTLRDGGVVPQLQKGRAPEDPNEIPFPDRTLIDQRRYLRPYSYLVTRKCPFTCSFCSLPAATGKPRFRTVDNLMAEIRADLPRSKGYFSFSDDTFTLNKKFVREFCQRVVDERLKLRWRCATRVDVLDEDLIVGMKKAGCEYIGFGLEAGNERVRQEVIGKGRFSNERIRDIVLACRKHGVVPNAFFMLGNPSETEADLEETADMIMSLPLGGVAISIPLPLPGSALYDMAHADGIINEDVIDRFARKELGIGATGVYPTYLRDLPKETVLKYMNRIFLRFYLRPGVALGWLKKDLENPRDLKEDIKSMVYLLRRGGSRRRPFV
jgi:anaerobic magnesium-protoporphyrin IX monomethyl ester cyclase